MLQEGFLSQAVFGIKYTTLINIMCQLKQVQTSVLVMQKDIVLSYIILYYILYVALYTISYIYFAYTIYSLTNHVSKL